MMISIPLGITHRSHHHEDTSNINESYRISHILPSYKDITNQIASQSVDIRIQSYNVDTDSRNDDNHDTDHNQSRY